MSAKTNNDEFSCKCSSDFDCLEDKKVLKNAMTTNFYDVLFEPSDNARVTALFLDSPIDKNQDEEEENCRTFEYRRHDYSEILKGSPYFTSSYQPDFQIRSKFTPFEVVIPGSPAVYRDKSKQKYS